MKCRYLIEISKAETAEIFPSLHTSVHYFNLSHGVSRDKILKELEKLKEFGHIPYALHICKDFGYGVLRYRKVILNEAR